MPPHESPHNNLILIVDDHATLRQSIKGILAELGYQAVEQASNGREAISVLQQHPVACIVSDWNMPGMDGLQLLEWVRTNPPTAGIPFMLLTADATRDRIKAALHRGVSDYLVKPFTSQQFRQRFQRLIDGEALPPQAPVERAEVVGLPPRDVDGKRKTILIVDDVKDNIEVTAGLLEQDYGIKVAISGQKALDIVAKQAPDLILLDVMMPGMDGHEVCRRLKQDEATRHIPIIFMTARDQPSDVAEGLELGAVDYVVKPAHPTVLRARVRTHLRLAQHLVQLTEQSSTLAEHAHLRDEVERMGRHDLKNPLTAALQASECLLDDPGIGPRQRELARLANDATRQAIEQVNRTLDLFRIETGTFVLQAQPFDLADILVQAARETETSFLAKGIRIQIPADAAHANWALGDSGLTASLLGNLLRNAAEASPDNGVVTARFGLNEQWLTLSLHNHGAIPPELRQRFFDKYATAGKVGGTGIGTYSARLYARAQNGELQFESDDAGGTTLILSLPAAPSGSNSTP
ncbi:hypothetical protein GCM10007907_14760 [Chitinimonas prasina]|uniref:histidine kinase n=1 Tax=Chitinimonas prasina TaxID=1434937 RepID=A0ABQ5YDR7_9NEIS|nr:response regulator [Chitinimonas prasina]GLR12686.1 hypothetical protein GCM10007907_14760 [Chitinimonas prasina]